MYGDSVLASDVLFLFFCFCFWVVFVLVFLFCFVFQDRVSLNSPGCPGTLSVDQAGLELRNPPASVSLVLGLKACTTTPGLNKPIFRSGILLSEIASVFQSITLHQQ